MPKSADSPANGERKDPIQQISLIMRSNTTIGPLSVSPSLGLRSARLLVREIPVAVESEKPAPYKYSRSGVTVRMVARMNQHARINKSRYLI